MRIPDPKAVTAEEAYLGYKAQIIEESELKPSLYEPYLHFDAWLAYWCGLTNTYPTDENENPEMLCDEEALVAYLSGVTDTYPEEIKDPYDVRITGYLRYLCSYRFGRPEYPVTNSEFYLSTMDAPHTSNETPSADIELDTSEGKLIDVKAYGDTYQQTYSGKNLFNSFKITDSTSLVTLTVDSDGIIYMSNNSYNNGYCSTGLKLSAFAPNLAAGQTYYIYVDNEFGGGGRNYIYLGGSSSFWNSGEAHTITQQELDSAVVIYGGYNATTSLKIMITTNQDSNYEKFVGGIPSPNPSYPQDIQVVTGEQTVNVHGKNLFDSYIATKVSWQSGDITVNPDGSISLSNNTGTNNYFQLDQTLGDLCPSLSVGDEVYLYLDTTAREIIYPGVTWNKGDKKTITQTMLDTNLVIYGGYGQTDTLKIMITKDQATAYQPYQSQDYKVNLTSKNLFDGVFTQGTYYNSTSTNRIITFQSPLLESGQPYTISFANLPSGFQYAVNLSSTPIYAGSGGTLSYDSGWKTDTITFTTSSSSYFAIVVSKTDNSDIIPADVSGVTWQLEKGSSPSSYQSYYNYELAKIGTYQDYIYKSGDDWYVHKECGKIIPDGSVGNWYQGGNLGDNSYYYTQYYDDIILGTASVADGFSNLFRVVPRAQADYGKNFVYLTSEWAKLRFYIDKTIVSGEAANFKTWLSQNTPIIYHILVTPTDTKITDSTLIGELDALAGADTYDEKTFIKVTATDPNLPALLKVEAYKY